MFITFEGIEGSGKTTQVRRVAQYLKDAGHPCVTTREPGGTRIGRKIRRVLLDPEHTMLDPITELMLYMADRAQHVKEIIVPALIDGITVICDRFFDATIAYQGYGRGLDIPFIDTFHKTALDGITPDLTLLLDLPVKTGLARAWERIGKGTGARDDSRFEEETVAFHEKVRRGYLELAKVHSNRIRIIDTGLPEEKVFLHIIPILIETLLQKKTERQDTAKHDPGNPSTPTRRV